MENDSVYDYSSPIHKSLIHESAVMGIGLIPVVLIVIITIVLMRLISIWCIFAGLVMFLIAKIFTRKEPHFLEFLFERMLTSDEYRS